MIWKSQWSISDIDVEFYGNKIGNNNIKGLVSALRIPPHQSQP